MRRYADLFETYHIHSFHFLFPSLFQKTLIEFFKYSYA